MSNIETSDRQTNTNAYQTRFVDNKNIEFTFWAPDASDVKLCIFKSKDSYIEIKMHNTGDGLYKVTTDKAKDNSLYSYKIDNNLLVPNPASNFQPHDVHGPSQIINHSKYNWENDSNWVGKDWNETIIYELHTGTFTKEGTFKGIEKKLDYIKELGITAIELMPVSDFPGKRNWGYDGVLQYAPDSTYGSPNDLKDLIKSAHEKGLMVLLDVVYNHFGPDGNYLYVYAKSKFFTHEHITPWGDAINFKNKNVRNFFIENAIYWLKEFHFDGLRLDAVHSIFDNQSPDILEELSARVREKFDETRKIHLVLENDDNASKYLEKNKKGYYNAQWNDDFHHCTHIFATDENNGYYEDYTNKTTKNPTSYYLARILSEGFAYQGEASPYRNNEKRGERSSHLTPTSFVNFIQNHDQIGNRALGERISELSSLEGLKAITSLYLLAPSIPLLYMGEEWGSKTPFYFFCDFNKELSEAVKNGRREEFSKFPQFRDPKTRELIPDPSDKKTFEKSKLCWDELKEPEHSVFLDFYKKLLKTRKDYIIPIISKIETATYQIMDDSSFIVEWSTKNEKLKLIANLSTQKTNLPTEINISNILWNTNENVAKQELINKIIPAQTVIWILE